ncbi:MAG: HAD-IIA family hydrolase [Oscillospiraceae bacterium]
MKIDTLKRIKYFVLDMDGTIYLGDHLFPETRPFLEQVEKTGREFCFFTNNSSKDTSAYLEKLHQMGIHVPPEKMLISNGVMTQWLLATHPGERAYVVGTPLLSAAVREAGIGIDSKNPDYVLLGFDTTLTYEKLVKACDFVRAGKPIFGLNPDKNCPTETGLIPDCGSIAALIHAATGVQCEFFGKPSRHTLQYILQTLNCEEEELAVVGDRLETDIAVAAGTGVTSILVLSGVTKREDLAASTVQPDFVFENLGELIPHLTAESH